jgi:predicted DsbA family dithiol-disulfide isomerase
MDIEENMDSARELNITTVPTVMIYNGTTLVNRSVGANIDSVYTNILDTL